MIFLRSLTSKFILLPPLLSLLSATSNEHRHQANQIETANYSCGDFVTC